MTTPRLIDDDPPPAIRDDASPIVEFESAPVGLMRAVSALLACDRRDDAQGVRRAIARLGQLMAKGQST